MADSVRFEFPYQYSERELNESSDVVEAIEEAYGKQVLIKEYEDGRFFPARIVPNSLRLGCCVIQRLGKVDFSSGSGFFREDRFSLDDLESLMIGGKESLGHVDAVKREVNYRQEL